MSELDQLVFGADYASEEAREKIRYLEDHVCPGPGACSLMGTANTMQILMEGLGMALPGSSTVPAVYAEKERYATQPGRRIVELVKQNIKPRDILTREALLNGVILTLAIAGSTNAVLHLLSFAREVGVELTLDDFDRLSEAVPVISRVIPTGKASVVDLYHAGGVPAVIGEMRTSSIRTASQYRDIQSEKSRPPENLSTTRCSRPSTSPFSKTAESS